MIFLTKWNLLSWLSVLRRAYFKIDIIPCTLARLVRIQINTLITSVNRARIHDFTLHMCMYVVTYACLLLLPSSLYCYYYHYYHYYIILLLLLYYYYYPYFYSYLLAVIIVIIVIITIFIVIIIIICYPLLLLLKLL